MKPQFLVSFLLTILIPSCGTAAAPFATPLPTRVLPTRTSLPTSTPTSQPVSLRGCVTNSTIRIRSGPGTEYEVIGGMVSGTCMSIQGRNEESDWVYMISEDNKTGWVAAPLLTIEGDLNQLSVHASSQVLSLVATEKIVPTQRPSSTATRKAIVIPTNTTQPLLSNLPPLCADLSNRLGESVSCKVPRAYCEYRPSVNGSPTFCDDGPYPNRDFQLVVFGDNWSDYDGECLIISGYLDTYRGVLQILATSRSQVLYC